MMHRRNTWLALACAATAAAGCASDPRADVCTGANCADAARSDTAATDTGARNDTGALDDGTNGDAAGMDAVASDGGAGDAGPLDGTLASDTGPRDTGPLDAGPRDAGPADTGPLDTGVRDAGPADTGASGPITGGPCLSGAPGATAWRVRWLNSGGRATVSYEVNGLPDRSRWRVTANSMTIGFTPTYTDMFLAEGGLQLDSGVFIDVEMSTVGLSSISGVTLAVYGRSFAVSTSGSFEWQTFTGVGAAPTDLVSNVPPYAWYRADATTEFVPGDGSVLLRIRPGPSSNSLVVNRLELCMLAR